MFKKKNKNHLISDNFSKVVKNSDVVYICSQQIYNQSIIKTLIF